MSEIPAQYSRNDGVFSWIQCERNWCVFKTASRFITSLSSPGALAARTVSAYHGSSATAGVFYSGALGVRDQENAIKGKLEVAF